MPKKKQQLNKKTKDLRNKLNNSKISINLCKYHLMPKTYKTN